MFKKIALEPADKSALLADKVKKLQRDLKNSVSPSGKWAVLLQLAKAQATLQKAPKPSASELNTLQHAVENNLKQLSQQQEILESESDSAKKGPLRENAKKAEDYLKSLQIQYLKLVGVPDLASSL